jgi:NADPH:quinone reductase-like Zn-dependent oxidoreductase
VSSFSSDDYFQPNFSEILRSWRGYNNRPLSERICGVDNLGLLGPEGGLACIAGIPDLSVVPDLPYSISIHDIGLGGVLASPAFRRRQEDLGRMATELMSLVQDGKIRPSVAEQITLEAIPKALERLAEGHVPGKIVARVQN